MAQQSRTLQNRVLPTGDIVAIPARGTLTGNRGVLHRADKTLGTARWKHHAWIICALDYKGWQRQVMTPNRWTELFFLDEAVALAAGHRPCALCRRATYVAYRDAWGGGRGPVKAPEMDAALHAARIRPGTRDQRRHTARLGGLPDGTMVLWADAPALILGDSLRPWTPEGYRPALARPTGDAIVLTPKPTLDVLRAGYAPLLHPSVHTSVHPSAQPGSTCGEKGTLGAIT